MLIDLIKKMKKYEDKFNYLCDIGEVDRAFKVAFKWNKIRKIVEFQQGIKQVA